jgi:hypothetical protein
MEKDIKKKLLIPFLVFLGFIAVSVRAAYRGIVNHETWRIVLASVSGLVFVAFIVLIVYTVVKNGRKAA